ncbi:MAG: heat-inducible transcriptional repressor HrcA [Clostridia bacterium]
MALDDRKQQILKAVVEDYIMSAEPVGSKALVEKYKLNYSSATIRNDMKFLEDGGYLSQPHISSGRIPSTKGYRYYVDNLMKEKKLSMVDINYIDNSISGFGDYEGLIAEASKVVSKVLQMPTICSVSSEDIIENVKVVNISDRILMVILISKSGNVKDCIVKLNENISEDMMNQMNTVLNQNLKDTPYESICDVLNRLIEREISVYKSVIDDITKSVQQEVLKKQQLKVNSESIPALLNLPEFEDIEKARNLINLLSTKDVLGTTLSKVQNNDVGIVIGSEIDEVVFKDYTIVSLNVKANENEVGKIGVIAPKRLDYSKTISTLKYIDKKIKNMLKK